jgi:aspartate aminotransferase
MSASILNAFSKAIPSSPTLAISEKASALRKQGHNVINLSVGEPDLPVPKWVTDKAIQAIENGAHTYTPVAGLVDLRIAICQKLKQENHLGPYDPHTQILVSTGAKQVLFNALMVSTNPGDEVIIPAPYWVSYPAMVAMTGGTSVIVPTCENTGFKLTPQALTQAISPRTRWLILNSPNNPTGAVYTRDELASLAQVLQDFPHVWILSDDIYEPMTYDGAAFVSILNTAPQLASRTLVVNGLSKSFSMTGWRLGYGAGPEDLIEAMGRLQSHSTSGACCITQYAGLAALSESEKASQFFAQQRALFAERRNILLNGLAPVFDISMPHGAFYLYAGCQSLMDRAGCQSDLDLAHRLLDETKVSCVPGTEFGLPGYLRFSYAVDGPVLHEASQRICTWADALQPTGGSRV